jgi:hypothetical protein
MNAADRHPPVSLLLVGAFIGSLVTSLAVFASSYSGQGADARDLNQPGDPSGPSPLVRKDQTMTSVAKLPSHVVDSFKARTARLGINPMLLTILPGSTDDIREDMESPRRRAQLFARHFGGGNKRTAGARLEENYYYSSRRFPGLTNNTIAGGTLTAGSFQLFNRGLGEDASGLGFPTGSTLTQAETNLDVGGYLPQGSNFVGKQLGVSFNSDVATADLAQFIDVAALNFSKAGGQFNMNQGPLKFWPGGTGVDGYAAAAVGGTPLAQTAAHNGASDIRAVRTLRIPRILREKEVFSYSIFVSRTSRATDGVAIALSTFVVATIWLFGGQKNSIAA